jgi:hypothetical protein
MVLLMDGVSVRRDHGAFYGITSAPCTQII